MACHDGPIHHVVQTRTPVCAECHFEHRGKVNLSAASNQACAQCHSNLQVNGGKLNIASGIGSFEDGHPEFDAVDKTNRDPGTIKLNHMLHMKPIRGAPNGPNVQLVCDDCHRPPGGLPKPWPYAVQSYGASSPSYTDADSFRPVGTTGLPLHNPTRGRELMAPVKFATACAACHLLTFDKRFDEGVPHDKPEVVHKFLVKKFADYIAMHSSELREMRDPLRSLTGKHLPPNAQSLTASQWVVQKTLVAEELLWKKTCAQCHSVSSTQWQDTDQARWSPYSAITVEGKSAFVQNRNSALHVVFADSVLPRVAAANTTLRWLPHSKFDHEAHTGFTCLSCHSKALTSTESSDILIPGIATCRTCHAPGSNHAESRCFECHTYHDWSKRKEVQPTFTLPALKTGM